ncbi:MAG: energy-coupling factor transporter transmembrane component T [Candidatus Aquicultor sp.]|nr:energy-coupling factor transporter transmembrane component T [Candidatus Aquicultor sp.]
MDIAFIDNLAYNRDSVMHRAPALSKVIMVALVIAAVVISTEAVVFVIALALLLMTFLISNLPVLRILPFAGYALVFSLVFAVSSTGGGIAPIVVMLKAVTAAVSMLLLITTTPYPQIFALGRKIFPTILIDAMLVTYRSFFILMEQVGRVIIALRMRGGYSPLRVAGNLNIMGKVVGHGFIHAWELSENMQNAMLIRGYRGGMPVSAARKYSIKYSLLPVLLGATVLVAAVFA